MEAALKEREKRLEEVKQAKSQKQEVRPTVLAYKKEVGLSISGLMCRWRSILGDADHRCPIIIGITSWLTVCYRNEDRFGTIDRESSFCLLRILLFVSCSLENDAANKA